MKMRTVDKMTWPEVDAAIDRAPIAYIPVGPQECHGAGMPMGTDIFVPEAVSLMAAEKTGGVVYKPFPYCFTGATSAFRGTVSIPISLQAELLKAIAKDLRKQNFEAICFVSIHGPNTISIGTAVRELFNLDGIISGLFNPYSLAEEMLKESGDENLDDAAVETAMCHAAMEYLELDEHIPDVEASKEEAPKPPFDFPENMMVGYHFTHIEQHQPVRRVDREQGFALLRYTAAKLAESVLALRKYANDVEKAKSPSN